MTTDLTARYLGATTAALPPASREDVHSELTALILDMTEARTEQGEEPEAAERAVLTELGDPAVLAASYADRPLHLLGPRYYLTWKRLLGLLLKIVPACAFVGVGLAQLLTGADVGTVLGESIGTALTAAVHVVFWTTLVFVILERTGTETGADWSVDDLPPTTRETGTGLSDLILSLVFLGLVLAALLWDHIAGLVHLEGDWMPVLNPGLWPGWTLVLALIVLAEAAHAIVLHVRGRWSRGLATVNTVVAAAAAAWALVLLAMGELLNPEVIELARTVGAIGSSSLGTLGVLLGLLVLGIAVWDSLDGWAKTRREARRV